MNRNPLLRGRETGRAVPRGLTAAKSELKLRVWLLVELEGGWSPGHMYAHVDMHEGFILGLDVVFCAILFWGALWGGRKWEQRVGHGACFLRGSLACLGLGEAPGPSGAAVGPRGQSAMGEELVPFHYKAQPCLSLQKWVV